MLAALILQLSAMAVPNASIPSEMAALRASQPGPSPHEMRVRVVPDRVALD